MYQGSCLCGRVTVEVSSAIESIIHCHCSKCRKNSGTAFATNGFVKSDGLKLLTGADNLGHYETSAGKVRHFCRTCASPIYSSNDSDPGRFRLRLGILDSPISERPMSHNFVSSKANCEDLDADLPRYDTFEPTR